MKIFHRQFGWSALGSLEHLVGTRPRDVSSQEVPHGSIQSQSTLLWGFRFLFKL